MNEDMLERLVRMETKLDAYLMRTEDHEVRLRAIEERKWPLGPIGTLLSAMGVIAAFASVIIAVLALNIG